MAHLATERLDLNRFCTELRRVPNTNVLEVVLQTVPGAVNALAEKLAPLRPQIRGQQVIVRGFPEVRYLLKALRRWTRLLESYEELWRPPLTEEVPQRTLDRLRREMLDVIVKFG